MNPYQRTFKHSGTVTSQGLLLMFLYGLPAALILSAVYAYALIYIPFVYINALLTCMVFMGVAVAVVKGAIAGNLRHPGVAAAAGLLCGAAALYSSWVIWIFAESGGHHLLLLDLRKLWQVIGFLNERGVWSFRNDTPKGIVLWVIWGAEALLIIGGSAVMAWSRLSTTPFCERCSCWLKDKKELTPLDAIEDVPLFKAHLEGGDYRMLAALKRKATKDENHTTLEFKNCPQCRALPLLTVTAVKVVKKKKKTEQTTKKIVENLIVDQQVDDVLKKIDETPAVAAEEVTVGPA